MREYTETAMQVVAGKISITRKSPPTAYAARGMPVSLRNAMQRIEATTIGFARGEWTFRETKSPMA